MYLNVVYRRFRLSLGLSQTAKGQISLFLGDIGSTRGQVGGLRQQLKAELDDEWLLWTDTSTPPYYPEGMGTAIHCSLLSPSYSPLSHYRLIPQSTGKKLHRCLKILSQP